jgi:hypothetical protein
MSACKECGNQVTLALSTEWKLEAFEESEAGKLAILFRPRAQYAQAVPSAMVPTAPKVRPHVCRPAGIRRLSNTSQ